MTVALIIFEQILVMGIFMALGYGLFRGKVITPEGSRTIASLLLWLAIPANIVNGFLAPYSPDGMRRLLISIVLALLVLAIAMLFGAILFRKSVIDNFAVAFSNAGFIGIPLVKNSLGDEAVFYLVGLVALLNIFQLLYGTFLFAKKRKSGRQLLRELFTNPIILSSIGGFLLYVLHLGDRLPSVLTASVEGLAALNAPLAMLVLGVYLAQADLKSLFTSGRIYLVSLFRLLVVPLATLFVLAVLPVDSVIRMTLFIAASAPVGANVAVYAQLYDNDYVYACKTVTQSTLFSLITMPLLMLAAIALIH